MSLGWGTWMAKSHGGQTRAARANRPQYMNRQSMNRPTGRRGETELQRSERIVDSQDRYDASIDRLDPRNPHYQPRPPDPE